MVQHAPRPAPADTDPRWQAVLARDAAADGRFVYAVRTTGVYCRPSCGARRPRPENVEFHVNGAAARRAGYRPCRRCRPDAAGDATRPAALVAQLCRYIEGEPRPPSLAQLAQKAGLSPFHVHRMFKAVTGLTPRAYALALRARRLRQSLDEDVRVTAAAYDAGFDSGSRFYAATAPVLGMTPTAFRTGGQDMRIRFALGQCSLGAILVAASPRGICEIALGDDPAALLRAFQERFFRAELEGADSAFQDIVARVVGCVEAPKIGLDLPLDIRGTAFQQRVWQALRCIPAGQTLSYSALARGLGLPRAARAVAGAVAANRLAVAIPCHRVVREDGSLSGYRWGVARKQELLRREAKP